MFVSGSSLVCNEVYSRRCRRAAEEVHGTTKCWLWDSVRHASGSPRSLLPEG